MYIQSQLRFINSGEKKTRTLRTITTKESAIQNMTSLFEFHMSAHHASTPTPQGGVIAPRMCQRIRTTC